MLKSLAKPEHPISKFSTGNLETLHAAPVALGLNIRELMIEFYAQHYSSNIMKLVLYGNHSLDDMEQWVRSKFSPIINKNLSRVAVPSDAYGTEQLCKTLEVVPIR